MRYARDAQLLSQICDMLPLPRGPPAPLEIPRFLLPRAGKHEETPMSAAFYRDYVVDLKARIDDLHTDPGSYQTYDLTMELLAQKNLISYAMSRKQGQVDSLFYRRDTASGQGTQMSQETAYRVFSGFFGLGQFLASTGRANGLGEEAFAQTLTAGWEYPTCAVQFAYRKKGQPRGASMKMLFVGLNGDADAATFEAKLTQPELLIGTRPFSTKLLWEWK